ncbi:MAG: sigma-70 family RNA polymerase sigma factor [Phycisphaeraceae bacterium]
MSEAPLQSDSLDARGDDELIALCNARQADAAAAFDALYQRYRQWVANLAFRFTRDHDTAMDVTQEVFIYLLRKFPGFVLTARLTTFLYPAVKNLSIASRHKTQRFSGSDDVLAATVEANTGDAAATETKARADLAAVMEGLSQGHREVLLMRFVDDMSMEEIAAALGIPTGTVKSRIHNALAGLRQDERVKQFFEV